MFVNVESLTQFLNHIMILLSEIIPDFVTINNINKNRSDIVAIICNIYIYMYNITILHNV